MESYEEDFVPLKIKLFERSQSSSGVPTFFESNRHFYMKMTDSSKDSVEHKNEIENNLSVLESHFVTKDDFGHQNQMLYDDLYDENKAIKCEEANIGDGLPHDMYYSNEQNEQENGKIMKRSDDSDVTVENAFKLSDDDTDETDSHIHNVNKNKIKLKNFARKKKKTIKVKSLSFKDCDDFIDRPMIATRCELCEDNTMYFPNSDYLYAHFSDKHVEEKNFTCDLCSDKFYVMSQLKEHRMESHDDKSDPQYRRICSKCDVTFKSSPEWNKHSCFQPLSPLKIRRYKCHSCPEPKPKFNVIVNLMKHYKRQHRRSHKITQSCDICDEEFTLLDLYKTHMRDEHQTETERQFTCGICNDIFSSNFKLTCHFSDHTGLHPFTCKKCKKVLKTLNTAIAHVNRHIDGTLPDADIIPVCEYCGVVFKTSKRLKSHINTKHLKMSRYTCEICSKGFWDRCKLVEHRNMFHLNIKKYVCDVCGQSFKSHSTLWKHRIVHLDARPWICTECGASFKMKSYYQNHLNTVHTTEKKFLCHICTMPFKIAKNLTRHLQTHTGVREHECKDCGKMFQRVYNLQVHQRIHTGEKPYKCPSCPRAFSQLTGLRSHTCGIRPTPAKRTINRNYVPPDGRAMMLSSNERSMLPSNERSMLPSNERAMLPSNERAMLPSNERLMMVPSIGRPLMLDLNERPSMLPSNERPMTLSSNERPLMHSEPTYSASGTLHNMI